MKEYSTNLIRNVALVGHSGAGKTSLSEAFLFNTGVITRLGRVEDGTTVADFEDEEQRRQISISTAVVPVEYQDVKINVIDTPGFTDFVGEVKSALRVVEAAIVVVDAVAGVEVGTELAWQYCDEFKLPRFVVINKMDRDNANFQKVLEHVQSTFKVKLIPVQLPWGEQQGFQGVIGLLSMMARPGRGDQQVDIPAEYADAAAAARVNLVEAAAEGEDELLEKYLGGEELTADDVIHGFHKAVLAGNIVPVFVASASADIGINPILDGIVRYLPAPVEEPVVHAHGKDGDENVTVSDASPLCAYVWKTTADPFVGKLTYVRVFSGVLASDSRVWNHTKSAEERTGTVHVARGKEQIAAKQLHAGDIGTLAKLTSTATGDTLGDRAHPLLVDAPKYPAALYSVAVSPRTQADSTKMGPALTRLSEEDPTLRWRQEPSTKQTIVEGMGDQHIDVAIRRAESKFGVGLTVEAPKVPYRESITKKAEAMHRHKKQTGGAGQFGEVWMRIEPSPDGSYNFGDELVGMNLSRSYLGPIEKGVKSVMEQGAIAGYPVVGVNVFVTDGKEHPVDSKPIAFEVAGREAFKKAVEQANPVLLEPIMSLKVVVPEGNMGDVLGDLNTRRARVQGMDQEAGKSIITAEAPLAEVQRYATELRSLTGGRGVYSMEFLRYDVVPNHLAQGIIAAYKREKKGENGDE
ncbi:MAG: elongation factor G [Anaerolineales bacterium]|nr:elongation factor G [Anaerolineales bacterium]